MASSKTALDFVGTNDGAKLKQGLLVLLESFFFSKVLTTAFFSIEDGIVVALERSGVFFKSYFV